MVKIKRTALLILISIGIFLVLSSLVTSYNTSNNNLMFYWDFNQPSNPIEDVKTNTHDKYNLTCTGGVTYQQAGVGFNTSYAVTFDGSDECVNADMDALWDGVNEDGWTIYIAAHITNTGGGTFVPYSAYSADLSLASDPETQFRVLYGSGDARAKHLVDNRGANQAFFGIWNTTGAYLFKGTTQVAFAANAGTMRTGGATGIYIGSNLGAQMISAGSKIGTVAIFNESLSGDDIADIIVNGITNGTAGPPTPPAPVPPSQQPNVTLLSPLNNSLNNTLTHNHTFNVSIENGTINGCSLFVNNGSVFEAVGDAGGLPSGNGTYGIEYTYPFDAVFEWNVKCNRTVTFNSSFADNNFTFTIDSTSPTVTINPSNFFTTSNLSTVNQYNNTLLPINLTFSDTNLFAYSINISKDSTTFFNFSNTSLNSETVVNYTDIINPGNFTEGIYNIEISVSDGHTANRIDDYDISKFANKITFDTYEGNEISISSVGAYSTIHQKIRDRYNFGFNYLLKDEARTFVLKSKNKIRYLENSRYKAHFVILSEGVNGNWIDFEGIGNNYTVTKISDYEYRILFTDAPKENQLILKSIGGLNIVTQNYNWYRGTNTTTFNSVATSESSQSFILSLTKDLQFINHTNATFIYNGISRTVTKSETTTLDTYTSTFAVPLQEATYNLSWDVNITQSDSTSYQYLINDTQDVFLATLNITLFDEENQSRITELSTFFLTLEQSRTETGNGTILLGNLTLGEYFIQAETDNYPRRGVFFTVANTSNELILYLVRDETGNDFVDYFVRDSANRDIENARMTFQKNINNSFVTTHQGETDFAGQQRFFQDQQNEYRIIIDAPNFPLKTISLFPLRTEYTIVLDTDNSTLYDNVYEGVRFTLSPQARILNITPGFTEVSLDIFDSSSSLQYFGVLIDNHTLECNPASCFVNISGIASGGKAIVYIRGNVSATADVHYFFKRAGFDVQYIHGDLISWQDLERAFGTGITSFMANIVQTFSSQSGRHSPMLSVIAAIGITVLCAIAAQFGVAGMPIVMLAIIGNLFFTVFGFIPTAVGIIMTIVGIFAYIVLARD